MKTRAIPLVAGILLIGPQARAYTWTGYCSTTDPGAVDDYQAIIDAMQARFSTYNVHHYTQVPLDVDDAITAWNSSACNTIRSSLTNDQIDLVDAAMAAADFEDALDLYSDIMQGQETALVRVGAILSVLQDAEQFLDMFGTGGFNEFGGGNFAIMVLGGCTTKKSLYPKGTGGNDDWDQDGMKNNVDDDDDNDGTPDSEDNAPFDSSSSFASGPFLPEFGQWDPYTSIIGSATTFTLTYSWMGAACTWTRH